MKWCEQQTELAHDFQWLQEQNNNNDSRMLRLQTRSSKQISVFLLFLLAFWNSTHDWLETRFAVFELVLVFPQNASGISVSWTSIRRVRNGVRWAEEQLDEEIRLVRFWMIWQATSGGGFEEKICIFGWKLSKKFFEGKLFEEIRHLVGFENKFDEQRFLKLFQCHLAGEEIQILKEAFQPANLKSFKRSLCKVEAKAQI